MLSRLRVAAPRRYVEQEPRNFNARTQRIEQLVPHVSEIDTGKPKKLPHIRQIGIPNVDFHSQTSKPGNSDVDFRNPLPDGANPAHLKMWTFAARQVRNGGYASQMWTFTAKPEKPDPKWGLSQPIGVGGGDRIELLRGL